MSRAHSDRDWQAIALQLRRALGGDREVAAASGVHLSTIRSLIAGASNQPLFDTGAKLLAAYSEHVTPIPGATELAGWAKP